MFECGWTRQGSGGGPPTPFLVPSTHNFIIFVSSMEDLQQEMLLNAMAGHLQLLARNQAQATSRLFRVAIAREIIVEHGGEIECITEVGNGAEFRVVLPKL